MNQKTFFIFIFLTLFFINKTFSSTTKTRILNETSETNQNQLNQNNQNSISQNNQKLKETMIQNIKVWTPILLFIIAAYAIFIISTMEIPKTTLLYATYVTSKGDKIN